MKLCSSCKHIKDEEDFSPDKRMKSGLKSKCKVCSNKYQKKKGFNNYSRRSDYLSKFQEKKRKTDTEYKLYLNDYSKTYSNSLKGKISELERQIKRAKKESTKIKLQKQINNLQNEITRSNKQ